MDFKQTLQWRHNECDGVSNHRRLDGLLNHLFRRRSKKHQSSALLAYLRGIHRSKDQLRGKCFRLMKSSSYALLYLCRFANVICHIKLQHQMIASHFPIPLGKLAFWDLITTGWASGIGSSDAFTFSWHTMTVWYTLKHIPLEDIQMNPFDEMKVRGFWS